MRTLAGRVITATVLSMTFAATAVRADDPFTGPRSKYQYGRERQFDFQHLKLDIALEPASKSLTASVTHTMAALGAARKTVRLDAEDLTLDGARVDGQKVVATATDTEFIIELPREYQPGETFELTVDYHGSPRKGIFFFGPAELGAGKPASIWTQGEDEDTHFWIPCYDYPNDKLTSEMLITVPAAFTAISNGALLGIKEAAGGRRQWHWKESVPHASYLVSLVAGEYEKFHQEWKGIAVDAYVPRGRLADAERSFGRTPEMMTLFSKLTGRDYPYEKYAQTAVPQFIFGGMENISATTQSDRTLHPAHLEEEESSDSLVAHELAHQWFGNYVSFKDWSNAWLSEGFATYFEALWIEHHDGPAEFQWDMEGNRRSYIGETTRYRRPVVIRSFSDPQDLFDSHLYPKGAWVLHMLRGEMGDERFFKGIRAYVAAHGAGLADTDDFRKAMEGAAGKPLDQFFDQWLLHPGHPELDAAWEYREATQELHLTLKQKQATTDGTRLFRFELPLEILFAEGSEPARVTVSEKTHEFSIPVKTRPLALLIDPAGTLLKTLSFEPGEKALRLQLARAGSPALRSDAAKKLGGKYPADETLAALQTALEKDSFWGVRAAAGDALSKSRSAAAKNALLAAIGREKSGRARERLVGSLTAFKRDRSLIEPVKKISAADPSDNVRAAALEVLGEIDAAGQYEYLKSRLNEESHHEVIRRTIFSIFGEHHEKRAIPLLSAATRPGASYYSRGAAAAALGEIGNELEAGREKTEIRNLLIELLDDPQFRTRWAVIGGLEALGDPAAIPALKAASGRYWDSRQKQAALDAIEEIQGRPAEKGELADMRKQFGELKDSGEALEKQLKDMQKELDKLKEQQAKTPAPQPPAAPAPASAPVPVPTPAATNAEQ